MKKTTLKASTLRSIMIVTIFITIGLLGYGFYYAQNWLNTYAVSVGEIVAKSTAKSTSSQGIAELQTEIGARQSAVSKASGITVSSSDYQSQIIGDLTKYALNNGILITDYDVANPAIADIKIQPISGVSSSYITITFGNPVPMTGLIKFLKSIETNLPKMQLTGISLKDNPSLAGTVNVDPITIEVYTK